MTPEEKQSISQLTAQMTSRCVGRYLVDLPAAFAINQTGKARIEDVEIDVVPMDEVAFDYIFKARKESLQHEKIMGEETRSLKTVVPIQGLDGVKGVIFDRSSTGESPVLRTLEVMAWREGYRLTMTIEARDMSATTRRFEGDTRRTDIPEKLAHLQSVLARTRGLRDGEVPQEPGVCFGHGFVQGAATDQEWVHVNYNPRNAQDGYFAIHSLSDIGPEKTTLLERGSAIEAELKENGGKTLRKGPRQANGLSFEEWLSLRQSDRKTPFYSLDLEMNSKQGNAQAPLLRMDFSVGIGIPRPEESLDAMASRKPVTEPVYSEAESVAIWDAVTSTLRKRPGGF